MKDEADQAIGLLDHLEHDLDGSDSATSSKEFNEKDVEIARSYFYLREVSAISLPSLPTTRESLDWVQTYGTQILLALAPSWTQWFSPRTPKKLHPTSYLDGLRGVAALFVVIHHHAITFFPALTNGWRSGIPGTNEWVLQMPFVRVIHSGRFMVAIFFVISGFVLSHKALRLAREQQFAQLLDTLSSSVFRRWIRLMLPALASTFVGFIQARLNLFAPLTPGWEQSSAPEIVKRQQPIQLPSFSAQFYDWWDDGRQLIDPFRFGIIHHARYNYDVLWTIQVEFMGSMVVFMTVLMLARTTKYVKLAILAAMIAHCQYYVRWEWFLFIGGVLLAELSHVRDSLRTPTLLPAQSEMTGSKSSTRKYIVQPIGAFFFILSIFLGSHPQFGAETSPGYRTMFVHIPTNYEGTPVGIFYPALAAVLMVLSLEHAALLQSIFTTRFAQYLGEISFSLYMLHCHVLNTLTVRIVPACLHLTGGYTQFRFTVGFALAMMLVMPFTFWMSDMFTRLVDSKSVRLARWLSIKCFIKG